MNTDLWKRTFYTWDIKWIHALVQNEYVWSLFKENYVSILKVQRSYSGGKLEVVLFYVFFVFFFSNWKGLLSIFPLHVCECMITGTRITLIYCLGKRNWLFFLHSVILKTSLFVLVTIALGWTCKLKPCDCLPFSVILMCNQIYSHHYARHDISDYLCLTFQLCYSKLARHCSDWSYTMIC